MGKKRIDEIVGYEKEKAEILQLRRMLHEFPKYRELGVRVPRGLLIIGEPGVGKTMLMKALPDRGIHCIGIDTSKGAEGVPEMFEYALKEAKKSQPAVVMIDEFDKLFTESDFFGMERSDAAAGIIKCLDSLSDDDAVLVVATCNDYIRITPELKRPGRFDRTLIMQLPNDHDRLKVAEKYLRKLGMPKRIRPEYVAKMTVGMTCADIRTLINEAGIVAAEKGEPELDVIAFRLAFNRFSFRGSVRDESRSRDEDYKIAVHEAGHALVAMMIAPDCLYEASILEQGNCAGHIKLIPDDTRCMSLRDLENRVTVSLAGRVAEREILGEYYVGSTSDLGDAVRTVRSLTERHAAYGYFGATSLSDVCGKSEPVSESTMVRRDRVIEDKLNEFDAAAEAIIRENRQVFNRIVDELVNNKVLSRDELLDIAGSCRAISA